LSTSALDTWQTVNIWTKNVTEVPKWFLPLNSSTPYETNEKSCTKFKKAENLGTNKVFYPKSFLKSFQPRLLQVIINSKTDF
jgi:hypothetical protein